jgi:hypothetical protein
LLALSFPPPMLVFWTVRVFAAWRRSRRAADQAPPV